MTQKKPAKVEHLRVLFNKDDVQKKLPKGCKFEALSFVKRGRGDDIEAMVRVTKAGKDDDKP